MEVAQDTASQGNISENRHAAIFGVGIGFIVFDSIIIALRIYARAFMLKALGADDILMITGTILTIGLSTSIMVGSNYGLGKHELAILQSDMVALLKCVWIGRLLFPLAMGLIKMSLLWFYLRLDPRKYMRWAVFFVMGFNILVSLVSLISVLATCNPPSLFWTDPTSSGFPMIYSLQLTWRKKGSVLGIFGLGILPIAAACVRYDFVTKLASAKEDYYILLADSSNWCTIEAYIAIFCGSAPSLFVLIKTYIPAIFGSTTARYPTTMQSARASYLQRRGPPRRNRRQGLRDTTLGSQDAIIPVSNPDSDQNGIIVKTDIEMHVVTGKSTEDKAHTTQHYNFSRPI